MILFVKIIRQILDYFWLKGWKTKNNSSTLKKWILYIVRGNKIETGESNCVKFEVSTRKIVIADNEKFGVLATKVSN